LPAERNRCDHFTTLATLTPNNCSAMLPPLSSELRSQMAEGRDLWQARKFPAQPQIVFVRIDIEGKRRDLAVRTRIGLDRPLAFSGHCLTSLPRTRRDNLLSHCSGLSIGIEAARRDAQKE
jgi:arginine/ornithine N-succinyltransferase beta subunit